MKGIEMANRTQRVTALGWHALERTTSETCAVGRGAPRAPFRQWRRSTGARGAARSTSLFSVLFLTALLLTAGCASVPKTSFHPATSPFPPDALVTQRGVLTVLGRQFTLNGYLALSATGGKRLVVTENFGNVLADVLITPDGSAHVMRFSRAFKPEWVRRYLAADVQCLTGESTTEECPGVHLSETRFLVQRRWYKLELQTVKVAAGPQAATMFDPSRTEKP